MKVKPSAADSILAGALGLLGLVVLINSLGNYRWFWPYDSQVKGVAILIGVVWFLIYGLFMRAWVDRHQKKTDRELEREGDGRS